MEFHQSILKFNWTDICHTLQKSFCSLFGASSHAVENTCMIILCDLKLSATFLILNTKHIQNLLCIYQPSYLKSAMAQCVLPVLVFWKIVLGILISHSVPCVLWFSGEQNVHNTLELSKGNQEMKMAVRKIFNFSNLFIPCEFNDWFQPSPDYQEKNPTSSLVSSHAAFRATTPVRFHNIDTYTYFSIYFSKLRNSN